jgi:OmpA-OmpF porin, OOP family
MQQQVGSSTISFQPTSYLKTSDGKKYKYLSATNIPKAPERRNVEPGKRYNFKIYFEKLPKGFELIDLIESKADKSKDFTFWNFYGILINNPAEDGKKKEEKYIEEEPENDIEESVVIVNSNFRIFGKIKDAESENTISAKISCQEDKNSIDSLQTSKSGSYEFILNSDSTVVLIVSAPGYQTHEESMNIKMFKNKEFLQKNIFLEKSIEIKPEKVKTEEPVIQKEELPVIKEDPKPIIGIPSENKDSKAAFKLDKVYFNLGDATLLPESHEQLNKLAEYLKENKDLKIQIEGHTDNQGDAKLNKKLSLERAFTVREYLVKNGVNSKRIKFIGLGDSQPVSSNNKEENRKQNRRVEYRFIE